MAEPTIDPRGLDAALRARADMPPGAYATVDMLKIVLRAYVEATAHRRAIRPISRWGQTRKALRLALHAAARAAHATGDTR